MSRIKKGLPSQGDRVSRLLASASGAQRLKRMLPNSAELDLSLPPFVKLRLNWEKQAGRKLSDEEVRERIVVYLRNRPPVMRRRASRRSVIVGDKEFIL